MTELASFGQPPKSLDAFSLVLYMVSLFEKNEKFDLPEIDIHRFMLKRKKEYPDIFSNILFDEDPELPYSADIADALLRLQDANVFTRPNPAMSEYLIKFEMTKTKKSIPQESLTAIEEIAEKFRFNFRAV